MVGSGDVAAMSLRLCSSNKAHPSLSRVLDENFHFASQVASAGLAGWRIPRSYAGAACQTICVGPRRSPPACKAHPQRGSSLASP